MPCTEIDFLTKEKLVAAVAAGEEVKVVSLGTFQAPENGCCIVQGPSDPPHTWAANVFLVSGRVTRVT